MDDGGYEEGSLTPPQDSGGVVFKLRPRKKQHMTHPIISRCGTRHQQGKITK
jgi:hypothetical protein